MTAATEKPAEKPRSLGAILTTVAGLTSAQHALLRRISAHSSPITVTELAEEGGLHVSSVRETLDALVDLGLVTRQQMPISGRGRPSLGYMTYTPADPEFPAQMLTQVTHAVFTWLRSSAPDPATAARQMGRYWADMALSMMHVPDHATGTPVPPRFSLPDHMDKIRLFLTAFGFAATTHPEIDTAVVLHACPFTDPDAPDPLALELRRGMVERVLELTATDIADEEYRPDAENPLRAEVVLTERTIPHKRRIVTTVRYYGGSADLAGCHSEEVRPEAAVATLGDLLNHLSTVHPALRRVLEISSFFVDQEPADRETALSSGARIDVLPPYAGG